MEELKNQVALEEIRESKKVLRVFIQQELVEGMDFGTIPGTHKPSLYKPGAEKLARRFGLGSRIVNRKEQVELEKKWAWFSYTIEIYHLISGIPISQCEGSCNSLEKKYYKSQIGDLLNTIQKMGQKRAFVGAVISAVGASDFFTHDVEDIEIAKVPHADREPPQRAQYQTEPNGKPIPLPPGKEMSYVVPFGKFRNKHLGEIPKADLEDYCNYVLKKGEEEGKKRGDMSTTVQEFLHECELYLFPKE